MVDYRPMWSDLGLALEPHDALLGVLSQAYQKIFLSQPSRPEGMKYFDFVMSEVHGLRIKELVDAKAQGRKVIGSYCVFVPEELILAVDGVSVGLCAGAQFGYEEAEKVLPKTLCPLIKSAFGFKFGKVCPYLEASDMVVGESTCDGKKKAYEVLSPMLKEFFLIDLPHVKSEAGKALLKTEYRRFADKLEEISGKKITPAKLKESIRIVNEKRKAVQRLAALRDASPAPISGLDALLVNQVFFYDDPLRFTSSVNKLCDELESRRKNKVGVADEKATRILVSGCPMAVPNWKLPWLVEQAGAVIVGEESCVGERGSRWMTPEGGETVEAMLDDITGRYFNIDCAVFTPNASRLDQIRKMVKAYNAQGVIHYTLQFCQPYQIEAGPIEQSLEKDGIPTLRIDTDYSEEDAGQIKTRIEAFIERLRG